ncbi:MAG: hypothetical protein BWX77_00132 [Bacteroidetes bacterium ADurb.Bin090]|nr:MAG: hypothetical protein BWX77_00132 [Bacteroidetes bacterium ADurb.Bin090]
MAASRGLLPRRICLVIFSSTTMASSTTIPMAIESEDIDMMLSELPVAKRYMAATTSEMGMVSAMISVALKRPTKKSTTTTTKSKAKNKADDKLLMDLLMNFEVSKTR